MVLKGLIVDHFMFGGCGGLESADFGKFPGLRGVVDRKGLTLDHLTVRG